MAEKAMSAGNYHAAVIHYSAALSTSFHEAPNYALRLPLAKALCLSGNKKEGRERLNSYVLMAKADIGELKCPEGWNGQEK